MSALLSTISIDLCMDYVYRLYCNKWGERDNLALVSNLGQLRTTKPKCVMDGTGMDWTDPGTDRLLEHR